GRLSAPKRVWKRADGRIAIVRLGMSYGAAREASHVTPFAQEYAACRCEWGTEGLGALAPADVTIIIYVFTFTTCVDDALGAGAVLAHLAGNRSVEAEACVALFERHRAELQDVLAPTSSGRELEGRRHVRDKEYSASLNASTIVPRFGGVAYVAT